MTINNNEEIRVRTRRFVIRQLEAVIADRELAERISSPHDIEIITNLIMDGIEEEQKCFTPIWRRI